MGLSEQDIEKIQNNTVLELAMRLEDDLVNSCRLSGETTVYDFIKLYL